MARRTLREGRIAQTGEPAPDPAPERSHDLGRPFGEQELGLGCRRSTARRDPPRLPSRPLRRRNPKPYAFTSWPQRPVRVELSRSMAWRRLFAKPVRARRHDGTPRGVSTARATRGRLTETAAPGEGPMSAESRIGVFVCHPADSDAGPVDLAGRPTGWAAGLPGVSSSRTVLVRGATRSRPPFATRFAEAGSPPWSSPATRRVTSSPRSRGRMADAGGDPERGPAGLVPRARRHGREPLSGPRRSWPAPSTVCPSAWPPSPRATR